MRLSWNMILAYVITSYQFNIILCIRETISRIILFLYFRMNFPWDESSGGWIFRRPLIWIFEVYSWRGLSRGAANHHHFAWWWLAAPAERPREEYRYTCTSKIQTNIWHSGLPPFLELCSPAHYSMENIRIFGAHFRNLPYYRAYKKIACCKDDSYMYFCPFISAWGNIRDNAVDALNGSGKRHNNTRYVITACIWRKSLSRIA